MKAVSNNLKKIIMLNYVFKDEELVLLVVELKKM